MNTLTFTHQDIYQGSLCLVSARHPLADEAVRRPLEALGHTAEGEPVLMEAAAARMMRCLLASAGCRDKIQAVSGYRSRAEQHHIYADTLRQRGEDFTRQFVALPGCSEHETGLAVDLAGAAQQVDFITPAFPQDGTFARFANFCSLYGFIERYPQGKSDITGIGFEPWHFRYVGRPHARIMHRHGWALEEYIAHLAAHQSYEDALVCHERDYSVRVFTLPVAFGEPAQLCLPDGALWQASGNNAGGVVVSVWQQ